MTIDEATENRPITQLLNLAEAGDAEAREQALSLLYRQVHDMARRLFRHEPAGHTLQATVVANEAIMRMCTGERAWMSRGEYLGAIRHVMGQVLVDHARRRNAIKRGGDHQRVPLPSEVDDPGGMHVEDLVALNEALARLEAREPKLCQIVILKFFHGLTGQEIAEAVGVSVRTVETKWKLARAWLETQMTASD